MRQPCFIVDEVIQTVLDTGWPAQPPIPVFSFETPDENLPAFVDNEGTPAIVASASMGTVRPSQRAVR